MATFTSQKLRLLIALGAGGGFGTVSTLPRAAKHARPSGVKQPGLATSVAFSAIAPTGLIQMVSAPLVGHLSDHIGRTTIMLISGVLLPVLIYQAFVYLVAHPTPGTRSRCKPCSVS